jgi:enoyl-CoA hydratase
MSQSSSTLEIRNESGILIITLNRPEKLNALNRAVLQGIDAQIELAYTDASIKAIIITGSGNKAFAAGADISEFSSLQPHEAQLLSQEGQLIFQKIDKINKPVIAAVNGFALGGGFELSLACHIRIASDNAKFGLPEATLGLLPGYGGTQRLPLIVGKGKAIEMMLTAEQLDATKALAWGIVNSVTTQEELIPTCISLLQKMLAKAPTSIQEVLRCTHLAMETGGTSFNEEAKSFGRCAGTQDFVEGVQAFMEKRKATFTGK